MNYKRCLYFVEGECERQLINALKMEPQRLTPGKVIVRNVIQDVIPLREVNMIPPGTTVIFVFDTDVERTDVLMKNIRYVKDYARQVKMVYMAQVLNFEDEIVRATDVRQAQELTKSRGVQDFKSDFNKIKTAECRNALERHHIDVSALWVTQMPPSFSFIEQNGDTVKL